MINLGIDFGSTYTITSVLDHGDPNNRVSYKYPSIVCYDKMMKRYYFGNSARLRLGKPNVVAYRGFKMLLNQQMDETALRERNYDSEHTPREITAKFLHYVINDTLGKVKEDKTDAKVDLLVIGAPECWFQSLQTVDARGTLRDICAQFKDLVNRVELRSEPTNAAAFCVWNYERVRNEKFSGKILVVDYGGGTLDTALVSVDHPNENIRIKPEMLSGIGENKDKEIGKAGIAYQEAVIRKVVAAAENIPESEVATDNDFDQAMKDFENALLNESDFVDEVFEVNEASPEALEDEIFTAVTYAGRDILVSFAQMKTAYDETIRDSLQKVLEESAAELDQDEEPYLTLVGGFCNFYLVRQQIQDFFNLGSVNAKVRRLFHKEEDRENAIAYGAGFLANHVIEVCNVANFGIGMYIKYSDRDEPFKNYAIDFGQEYVPDQIYFAHDNYGSIAAMVLTEEDTFLLNFSKNKDEGFQAKPKAKFAQALKKAKHKYTVVVGFSIDNAERIRVYIFDYMPDTDYRLYGTKIRPAAVIPLSTFKGSFDNMVVPTKTKPAEKR